jgi:hypothetical protein
MKTRLATEIGTRVSLRIYWGDNCQGKTCHEAQKHIEDVLHPIKDNIHDYYGGNVDDYPFSEWPTECDHCGSSVPTEDINKQIFNKRLYDTPSGNLEPGCLYWIDYLPETFFWDNHVGPHLAAVLPNGHHWYIDSRASNCTLPEDRTHRCWVRHGEIPNIHVDKNGHTCSAGAGSIWVEDYHGFLHHGKFT